MHIKIILSCLLLTIGQSISLAQVSRPTNNETYSNDTAKIIETSTAPRHYEIKDKNNIVLGICEHLWGRDRAYIDRVLDAAAKIKMKAIRWDAPWKAVETEKGKNIIPPLWDYIVDASKARGIETLLILDYGNPFYDGGDKPTSVEGVNAFAAYAESVAAHFRGRVKYYEIWNEWDGRTGNTSPGSISDYVRLVNLVYPKIKSISPESVVLIGALDTSSADSLIGYGRKKNDFEKFLDSPDIASVADGISIHPYVVYRKGEMRDYRGFEILLESMVRRIRQTPGFESKPIVISEIGWSTSLDERGVSESIQATNLQNAIQLADRLGVAMLFIYELLDDGNRPMDTEAGFGLIRYDWTAKPIYENLLK